MHRFYLPNFDEPTLTGGEVRHATQVLRLKLGDAVCVFDGRGRAAHGLVADISKQAIRLELSQQTSTPPLRCRVTLVQAIPKKNMDLIVQKATELGVATIVPVISERTVVQLEGDSGKLDRWRGIAMESCKQCGNNWLPEILPPQQLERFLRSAGKYDLKLVAALQPDALPLKKILAVVPGVFSVLMLIGPEGDFTTAEYGLARETGCRAMSLGSLVLRAETAALYALSVLHHELQTGE